MARRAAQQSKAESVWRSALSRIKLQVGDENYATYFSATRGVSLSGRVLRVFVGSIFIREALETRFKDETAAALEQVVGTGFKIKFDGEQRKTLTQKFASDFVSPRLTFDTFVDFPASVRFRKMGDELLDPGIPSGTIFVRADLGMGATHLLHALGNLAKLKGTHTLYTTVERFSVNFTSAIRSGNTRELRERYAAIDLLLIDEVQELKGKVKTQEFLCHILTDYELYGGKVVAASTVAAERLGIYDKLQTRFSFGEQLDIKPLNRPDCVELAKKLAPLYDLPTSHRFISNVCKDVTRENIRTLIARLKRSRLRDETDTAVSVAADSGGNDAENLLVEVCQRMNISADMVKSSRRDRSVSQNRGLVTFILVEQFGLSVAQVAKLISKSHQAVLASKKKVARAVVQDERLLAQVAQIKETIELSNLRNL